MRCTGCDNGSIILACSSDPVAERVNLIQRIYDWCNIPRKIVEKTPDTARRGTVDLIVRLDLAGEISFIDRVKLISIAYYDWSLVDFDPYIEDIHYNAPRAGELTYIPQRRDLIEISGAAPPNTFKGFPDGFKVSVIVDFQSIKKPETP